MKVRIYQTEGGAWVADEWINTATPVGGSPFNGFLAHWRFYARALSYNSLRQKLPENFKCVP